MLKMTLTKGDFIELFKTSNNYRDNFTSLALSSLFDYLDILSDSLGEDINIDMIAICCEYSEMSNIDEFNEYYGTDYESMDEIEETVVIDVDSESFIIQDF